jgi:TGS domain
MAADGDEKRIGGDSFVERQANPAWLRHRAQVYDEIAALRQAELAQKRPVPISVTLPDGKVLESDPKTNEPFVAWKTTPFDVASSISAGLADASTVAKVTYREFVPDYQLEEDGMVGDDTLMSLVNDDGPTGDGGDDDDPSSNAAGERKGGQTFLWDMTRPLVGSASRIEFLKFEDSQDAKTVFWHSSAHMMGEALERLYGCKLTIGPPLAGGFYYDSYMNADTIKEDDCTCNGGGIDVALFTCVDFVATIPHTNSRFSSSHIGRRPRRGRSGKDHQAEAKVRAARHHQGRRVAAVCRQPVQGEDLVHEGPRRRPHHRLPVRGPHRFVPGPARPAHGQNQGLCRHPALGDQLARGHGQRQPPAPVRDQLSGQEDAQGVEGEPGEGTWRAHSAFAVVGLDVEVCATRQP